MFRHTHGSRGKSKKTQLSHLIAMTSPALIEQDPKIVSLMQRIEEASSLDASRYMSFYVTLIKRLMNYVELLPDSTHPYYAEKGGFLEYALQRTEVALLMLRPYLLLEHDSGLSDIQCCWQYALFSAALLRGIGKLYLDYQIELYSPEGEHINRWNPFLEQLISPGHYYTYQLRHESQHHFRRQLNAVLAERMMPSDAFSWLVAHPPVLEAWLALLNEDVSGARVLESILTRAEDVLLAKSVEELLAKLAKSKPKSFLTFDQTSSDAMSQLGLLFLKWLKHQLETGALCLNEGSLALTSEGMLLKDEVFKLFAEKNPQYKNWQAVQRGFLSLGFHDTSVNTAEVLFARFGMVLPTKARLLNPVTGQKIGVSALEATYFVAKGATFTASDSSASQSIPKLSEKGVWQEQSEGLFLKPGQSHRG